MGFLDSAPFSDDPVRLDIADVFAPAVAVDGDVARLRLLVNGSWRLASEEAEFDVASPIDGTVIARAQRASAEDVNEAIASARDARAAFGAMPATERVRICGRAAQIMSEHLDDFIHAIVVDLGKTGEQAGSEASAANERLELVRDEARKIYGEYLPGEWVGDTSGKMGIVLREPVGTVGAIGPFNYPLFLSASKIIPAIAAGNTVVAKAPSADPVPLLMFARMLEEAGLPPGVLNVITGSGSQIGDLLSSHEDVSMVTFTGSSAVGRRIAEKAGPKPLHLELGGNAAAIVLADADPELAVSKTVDGAFKNAGQRCDAISRVLVEDRFYDEYVERALQEARGFVVGDPRDEDVDVGPLVDAGAAKRVNGFVEDAVSKGARLQLGGEFADAYHQPTVLVDVPLGAEILWEEHFGPVLPVTRVRDLQEALEISNQSRYGLDSSVFTDNLDRAWSAAEALEVGMVTINDAPKHGVGHFPFGGRKPDSGLGREGLGYSIDECTQIKTVVQPLRGKLAG